MDSEEGKKAEAGSQGEDHPLLRRAERAFGPVAAGVIMDLVDLATFGPAGLMLGGVLGFACGFWICSIYRMNILFRVTGGVIGGIYCMIPTTEIIPAATLVGLFVRFFEPENRTESDDPEPGIQEKDTSDE